MALYGVFDNRRVCDLHNALLLQTRPCLPVGLRREKGTDGEEAMSTSTVFNIHYGWVGTFNIRSVNSRGHIFFHPKQLAKLQMVDTSYHSVASQDEETGLPIGYYVTLFVHISLHEDG